MKVSFVSALSIFGLFSVCSAYSVPRANEAASPFMVFPTRISSQADLSSFTQTLSTLLGTDNVFNITDTSTGRLRLRTVSLTPAQVIEVEADPVLKSVKDRIIKHQDEPKAYLSEFSQGGASVTGGDDITCVGTDGAADYVQEKETSLSAALFAGLLSYYMSSSVWADEWGLKLDASKPSRVVRNAQKVIQTMQFARLVGATATRSAQPRAEDCKTYCGPENPDFLGGKTNCASADYVKSVCDNDDQCQSYSFGVDDVVTYSINMCYTYKVNASIASGSLGYAPPTCEDFRFWNKGCSPR